MHLEGSPIYSPPLRAPTKHSQRLVGKENKRQKEDAERILKRDKERKQ